MFYVKIEVPINLKGERQELYGQFHKKSGLEHGIHCVRNGRIIGEHGVVKYWDYIPILEMVPVLIGQLQRSQLDDLTEQDINKEICVTLFWENGLLLEGQKKVLLLEKSEIFFNGERAYLLLCEIEGSSFQVIVPEKNILDK